MEEGGENFSRREGIITSRDLPSLLSVLSPPFHPYLAKKKKERERKPRNAT
jgi:hypothetical protein